MTIYRRFKGTSSEYRTIHNWATRVLGNPQQCENCETTTAKRYEWANISDQYLRDASDWARLCTICHALIDGRGGFIDNKCRRGHELTPDTIYNHPNGTRCCRVCKRRNDYNALVRFRIRQKLAKTPKD